jgi:hypothetical protein
VVDQSQYMEIYDVLCVFVLDGEIVLVLALALVLLGVMTGLLGMLVAVLALLRSTRSGVATAEVSRV